MQSYPFKSITSRNIAGTSDRKSAYHEKLVCHEMDSLPKNPPRLLSWVVLVLILGMILGSSFAFAQEFDADSCYEVALSEPLIWITSMIWNGESLLAVDTYSRTILKISTNGQVTDFDEPGVTFPSQIRTRDVDYLVQDENKNQLLSFSRGLNKNLIKAETITAHSYDDQAELKAIYDWTPFGGGYYAFGDLKKPDGSWEMAFFSFGPDDGTLVVYKSYDLSDPIRNFYLLNVKYISPEIDGKVYFLLLDEQRPRIGEVGRKSTNIREIDLPEGFRTTPTLMRLKDDGKLPQGPRNATAFYRKIETSTMPLGLFGRDGDLFLLSKEPYDSDRLHGRFRIFGINPTDGTIKSSYVLPLGSAAHVTVAAGEHWAFLRKGPVEAMGEIGGPFMPTTSILFIPHAWLESPAQIPLGVQSQEKPCIQVAN